MAGRESRVHGDSDCFHLFRTRQLYPPKWSLKLSSCCGWWCLCCNAVLNLHEKTVVVACELIKILGDGSLTCMVIIDRSIDTRCM